MMGQDYTLAIVHSRLALIRYSPWLRRAIAVMTFVAAALAFPQPALAGISVTGSITSNTTWAVADSPITVTGHVTVDAGVTLTVEPGVTVEFDTGKVLDINGTLIAQGTSSDKVTFTSSAASPAAGDWGYIRFKDGASPSAGTTFDGADNYVAGSILKHCIVEYAGSYSSSVSTIDNATYVDSCTFKNNSSASIDASFLDGSTYRPVRIIDSLFDESNGGASIKSPRNATISGNTLWGGGVSSAVNTTISGNIFR